VALSSLTPQQQQQYKGKNLQVSESQFAAMMGGLKYQVAQAAEAAIQSTWAYGTYPAAELNPLIWQAINNIPQEQLYQEVNAPSVGGYQGWVTQAITTNGLLGQLVSKFNAENPQYAAGAAQTTMEQNFVTAWEQAGLGTPTAAQIQQGSNMSSADQTIFINEQPDPKHPGFTVGAWSSGYNTVLSQWEQNMGYGSTPTDAQVTALMGMNSTQLADYFYNSPSPVSGMNNGTYKGYDTLINSVRGDLTPSMGSDFLSSLTQKLNPTQQAAANAANLKPGTAAVAG
jgi:hypothetical protein